MAFNQKNKRLGKFLDFIGLVDTEKEEENEFDNAPRARGNMRNTRSAAPIIDEMDDPFGEEPPRRASVRPQPTRNSRERGFDGGDEWMENGRIDYRSAQPRRAGNARPSAPNRYANSGYAGGSSAYEEGYRPMPNRASSRVMPDDFGMEGERRNPYRQQPARPAPQSAPRMSDTQNDYDNGYEGETSGSRHQMVVYDLRTVNECKEVILALLAKKSVLVNLVAMNQETAQRALDTLSGATFAINARISRASDTTWLFTPSNVEVASQRAAQSESRFM